MKPVIGVFGGTRGAAEQPLAMARALGAALVRRGAVVLTGGYGPGEYGVKGAAIAGAGDGAWIGIGPDQPLEAWPEGRAGIVLSTGLEHQRNYVEAALCDGAVCLPGQDGTLSEAAFCMALGRPVAFWGDAWASERRLPLPAEAALGQLSEAAARKVAGDAASGLAPLLSADAIRAGLLKFLPCRAFPSAAGPEQVLAWLLEAAGARAERAGVRQLPQFAGSARLQRALDAWLQQHEAGSSP